MNRKAAQQQLVVSSHEEVDPFAVKSEKQTDPLEEAFKKLQEAKKKASSSQPNIESEEKDYFSDFFSPKPPTTPNIPIEPIFAESAIVAPEIQPIQPIMNPLLSSQVVQNQPIELIILKKIE